MIRSMTGFASGTGHHKAYTWTWEVRSVNGKGFDLRLRVPDWIDGLETALRGTLAKAAARGNVTLSLRVSKDEADAALQVNAGQLASVLKALAEVEAQALEAGASLAPSRAADLLALRGVLEHASQSEDTTELSKAIVAALPDLIADFNEMRVTEGAALEKIMLGHLDDVAELTATAASQAEARKENAAEALRRNMAMVLDNTDGADPDRVAQELALLAVKSDVTEEIDRLSSHVDAARDLIAGGGAVGRKLDFLMQEFNREANTLCSKAQNTELTRTGLALKAVIDQMREQVQNVE